MNVVPADRRSLTDFEFYFSEQPSLSDELRMLREQVRRFVEKEVVPHGEQWERHGERRGECRVGMHPRAGRHGQRVAQRPEAGSALPGHARIFVLSARALRLFEPPRCRRPRSAPVHHDLQDDGRLGLGALARFSLCLQSVA